MSFLRSSHQSLQRRLDEWSSTFDALLPAQALRQQHDKLAQHMDQARQRIMHDVHAKVRQAVDDALTADSNSSSGGMSATRAAVGARVASSSAGPRPYAFAPSAPPAPLHASTSPPTASEHEHKEAPASRAAADTSLCTPAKRIFTTAAATQPSPNDADHRTSESDQPHAKRVRTQ